MLVPLIAAASLAGAAAAYDATTTIEVAPKRPQGALLFPGNVAGFSLETDRWNEWTGNLSHPNTFTYALLSNLRDRTGVAGRFGRGLAVTMSPSLALSSFSRLSPSLSLSLSCPVPNITSLN